MLSIEHPRIKVFANFVEQLATLSKCTDKQIAAIIIDEEATQVYSIGVNGGPKGGTPECLCTLGGKYTCAHAEANALAKCTVDCNGKAMMCTMSPCIACATIIINSGIKQFFYIRPYHDNTGIELLKKAGVEIACFEEPLPGLIVPEEYKPIILKLIDGQEYFIPETYRVTANNTVYDNESYLLIQKYARYNNWKCKLRINPIDNGLYISYYK